MTMNRNEHPTGQTAWPRMVILVVVGVVAANVVGAVLFERDTGLGLDELWVLLAGLTLAALVEFGYFRRRRR